MLMRDMDVIKIYEATMKNGNRVHLYFEHPVVENPKVIENAEVVDEPEDPDNSPPSPYNPHHITPHHITLHDTTLHHRTLHHMCQPLNVQGTK